MTSLGDVNASHVSPHCLASVRIIALDVLDPLKAIIHPRVRPLPYLTMTASEQYDVLGKKCDAVYDVRWLSVEYDDMSQS